MLMIIASVAMVCSLQASAATPALVLKGTPAQVHAKAAFGYVEVDNFTAYEVIVYVPSVSPEQYVIEPGEPIAFYVGTRLGATVYTSYYFAPYSKSHKFVLNGETVSLSDGWDPVYGMSKSSDMSKGSPNLKMIMTTHKTAA